MTFFRQVIAPFLIVLVFLVALLAVSARIFLPSDMAAPAPIEEVAPPEAAQAQPSKILADLPQELRVLVQGLPEDPSFSGQL